MPERIKTRICQWGLADIFDDDQHGSRQRSLSKMPKLHESPAGSREAMRAAFGIGNPGRAVALTRAQ